MTAARAVIVLVTLVSTARYCHATLGRTSALKDGTFSVQMQGTNWTSKDPPPPHQQLAKMARFIVHTSDWLAMSTISAREPIAGFPFANIFSVSDGPIHHSTGVPYMYLTDMEMSMKDLKKDPRASVTMSLAQTDYCKKNQIDPESPLCAHVILTGTIVKVTDAAELKLARRALFSRHSEMKDWPHNHGWWFGKMNATQICLLDYFGGAQMIDLDEYYRTSPGSTKQLH